MGAAPPPPKPAEGGPPGPGGPTPPGPDKPAEEKPAAPQIDPSTRYGKLGTIKVMAAMFMFICMALNIVFIIYDSATGSFDPGRLATLGGISAMVVTILAVVLGIMAIFISLPSIKGYSLKMIFIMLAPLLMIVGAAIKPTIMNIGEIDMLDLILALVFGVFFILFVEYIHAVYRFTQIGKMAIERNLKDFDFDHVINHYMGFGGAILGVIVVISVIVVFIRQGILAAIQESMPQFANSVEMNSVYGLAISSAIFFSFTGIALSFYFGQKDYLASVRAVSAFSKERMRQMSEESTDAGTPLTADTIEVPKE